MRFYLGDNPRHCVFCPLQRGRTVARTFTRRISIFVMLVCVAQKYDEIDHPAIGIVSTYKSLVLAFLIELIDGVLPRGLVPN